MMNLSIQETDAKDWKQYMERSNLDHPDLSDLVQSIFTEVKAEGIAAVKKYAKLFDDYDGMIKLSEESRVEAIGTISGDLKEAIQLAYTNIRKFHEAQQPAEQKVEIASGISCTLSPRALECVGLYIPGGTAPLISTVLMLGVPAQIAQCRNIVLCTPPGPQGEISPAILYAAQMCGIKNVYRIGGIQAIAAFQYGTELFPKVDKIFGPGNKYVTAAKMYAQSLGTPIDLPAGPSELLVLADESAHPQYLASDLLSQAEHDPHSQVILAGTERKVLEETIRALETQLDRLPRKQIAVSALERSSILLLKDKQSLLDFSNAYAPEHLIIAFNDAAEWSSKVRHAGSVFLGHFSPESAGDYASGTNHTLPTHGYAQSYSGLNLLHFYKWISFQHLTQSGLESIGPSVIELARAEQLEGHAQSIITRLNSKTHEYSE
jgi:histidinol dehydrogenase